MITEDQREEIITELQGLNKKVARQNSVPFIFFAGMIYGVGFFLGSAILATILFGIFAPYVGEIDWIRDTFLRGAALVGN